MNQDQRIQIVAALVASLVKRGEIFEDQMLRAREDLIVASNEELLETCEELCPGDLRGVGF